MEDGERSGGSWASDRRRRAAAEPRLRQPSRTAARRADPTVAHAHPRPSLPAQTAFTGSDALPSLPRRRHRQHPERNPPSGLLIHPRRKVKNPITYAWCRGARREGAAWEGSPSPANRHAPGLPRHPGRPRKPLQHHPSIFRQTLSPCRQPDPPQHLQFSRLAPARGAEPRCVGGALWYPHIPPPRSPRDPSPHPAATPPLQPQLTHLRALGLLTEE